MNVFGFSLGIKEALAAIGIVAAIGVYIYVKSLSADLATAQAGLAVATAANQQAIITIEDLKNQNALNGMLLQNLEQRNAEMTIMWQDAASKLASINNEASDETASNLNDINASVNRMLESASDIRAEAGRK